MRILLLDHPQFTAGTYLLWHGLKELEQQSKGVITVDVYPPSPTHYDQDSYDVMEQFWFQEIDSMRVGGNIPPGIPPFSPGEMLNYHDQRIITRFGQSLRFPHTPDRVASRLDQVTALVDMKAYDFIILGNSHRVPTMVLARIRQRVSYLPPIVYYDAGERDELNEHWVHVFRPQFSWKQILTPAVLKKGLSIPTPGYEFKVAGLPLSSILVDQPGQKIGFHTVDLLRSMDESKMLDVFYQMGITCDERIPVLKHLEEVVPKLGLTTLRQQIYENYHIALAKSRMAVTMRGSGRDTLRYWEIPLYNTAMLSDGTMGCIHPFPFKDQETAVFWNSKEHLAELLARYANPESSDSHKLVKIAAAGKAHLRKYHSTVARAMQFLTKTAWALDMGVGKEAEFMGEWMRERKWDVMAWDGPVV